MRADAGLLHDFRYRQVKFIQQAPRASNTATADRYLVFTVNPSAQLQFAATDANLAANLNPATTPICSFCDLLLLPNPHKKFKASRSV